VSSTPGRFTPWERAPDTYYTGGWEGPRASLDAAVKRKTPAPAGYVTPDNPDRKPSGTPPRYPGYNERFP